jgi:hypothetical protein
MFALAFFQDPSRGNYLVIELEWSSNLLTLYLGIS